MAAQTGYYDTLKSAAGKVFSYLASITLTGTDGKTITCTQDTSLDEAVAMSSKAPVASPSFTGTVTALSTGNTAFAAVNQTNTGVHYVGSDIGKSMTDNQTITITQGSHACLILLHEDASGKGAAFLSTFASAAIVELADPSTYFAPTDSDLNPGWAIYKAANSSVVTIKNYSNATNTIVVNVIGVVAAATNPA